MSLPINRSTSSTAAQHVNDHNTVHGITNTIEGVFINPKDPQFAGGAVGDGVANDLAALQAAVTATPDGGTLFIPPGKFRINSTWTINKRINVLGCGPRSTIWLNVGGSNDGVVFDNGTLMGGAVIQNFAVAGGAASCRAAMVFRRFISSSFRNLWVKAGGTSAYSFEGCLINDIRPIYCTINWSLPYDGTMSTHGIQFIDLESYPSNTNKIHAVVEGISGVGLAVVTDDPDAGNNYISGTYESCATAGITMQGCSGFQISDAHLEGVTGENDLVLDNCRDGQIGPALFLGASPVLLTTCSRINLDGVYGDLFTIANSCIDMQVGDVKYGSQGANFIDNGVRTNYTGTLLNLGSSDSSAAGPRLADSTNLLPNGNAERWSSTIPTSWGVTGTATRCGVGMADTQRRFGNYCVKVVGGSSNARISVPAALEKDLDDQWVTGTAWVYIPSGQGGNSPSIYIQNWLNGGAQAYSSPAVTATNVWTKLHLKTRVPAGTTGIALYVNNATSGSGTFYVDGLSMVAGRVAPAAIVPHVGNADLALRISDLGVNVKDQGAVGDGVANDQPAIAAAITAAGAGGTVFFPVGNYKITSGIAPMTGQNWLGAGSQWNGDSTGGVAIIYSGTGAAVTFNAGVQKVKMQNFKLQCTSNTSGVRGVLLLDPSNENSFESLTFIGPSSANGIGTYMHGMVSCNCHNVFTNCLWSSWHTTIWLSGYANANMFMSCVSYNCTRAIDLTGADGDTAGGSTNTFLRHEIDGSTTHGIRLGTSADRNMFIQVVEDGVTTTAYDIASSCIYNQFVGCGFAGTTATNSSPSSMFFGCFGSGGFPSDYIGNIVLGTSLIQGVAGEVIVPGWLKSDSFAVAYGDSTEVKLGYFNGRPGVTLGPLQTVGVMSGSGSPETVVAAGIGSLYLRTNGGAGTSLYVKQTGTGNTGWAAVTP